MPQTMLAMSYSLNEGHAIMPSTSLLRWAASDSAFASKLDVKKSSSQFAEDQEPPQKQRRRPPRLPTSTHRLTVGLLDVYRNSNAGFVYVGSIQNPRRVLTKDARPGGNHGFDNKAADLILTVGDVLGGSNEINRFKVLDMLGQGTFGQVVKCKAEWSESSPVLTASGNVIMDNLEGLPAKTPPFGSMSWKNAAARSKSSMVAVKIVKNKPAYHGQARVEIKVLQKLTDELGPGTDPDDPSSSLIRLLDSFEYHGHLCLVFELMSVNLYELIKHQDFRGLPFTRVRTFCTQLIDALDCLCKLNVIHCDVKPENILLENFGDPTSPRIKLIDLGSACYRDHVAFTYIQSRFYRAPEVLVGIKYSSPIDLWSLGCVAIELYMGLPVFPGVSAHNQFTRIIEMMGNPPDWMVEEGKKGESFFLRIPPGSGTTASPGLLEHASYLSSGGIVQGNSTAAAGDFDFKEDYFVAKKTPAGITENLSFRDVMTSVPPPSSVVRESWRLKTPQEWAVDNGLREGPEKTKRYVKEKTLFGIVHKCEAKRRPKTEPAESLPTRDLDCFVDFCSGLLRLDPNKRWTAAQARLHPFIKNARYQGPFVPPTDVELAEEEDLFLLPSSEVGEDVPDMEIEEEEDEEAARAEAARRIKTRTAPVAIKGAVQHQQHPSGIPTSSSVSISASSASRMQLMTNSTQPLSTSTTMGGATGFTPTAMSSSVGGGMPSSGVSKGMSQQARYKRKLSDASALTASPQIGSYSSIMGSPISRPEHPYPIAHHSRWSDLGALASPGGYQVGMPTSTGGYSFMTVDRLAAGNGNGYGLGQSGGLGASAMVQASPNTEMQSYSLAETSAFGNMGGGSGLVPQAFRRLDFSNQQHPSAFNQHQYAAATAATSSNNSSATAWIGGHPSMLLSHMASSLPTQLSSSWNAINPLTPITNTVRQMSDSAVPTSRVWSENESNDVVGTVTPIDVATEKSLARWAPFDAITAGVAVTTTTNKDDNPSTPPLLPGGGK